VTVGRTGFLTGGQRGSPDLLALLLKKALGRAVANFIDDVEG
jgi:hypothetical protein